MEIKTQAQAASADLNFRLPEVQEHSDFVFISQEGRTALLACFQKNCYSTELAKATICKTQVLIRYFTSKAFPLG